MFFFSQQFGVDIARSTCTFIKNETSTQAFSYEFYWKQDSNTTVSLWILQNL